MKSTSYKVQIKASVNGTTVSPKQIAWIHGNDSCLAMPCYKENDYFVIEIIPDCIGGNCIEGYIMFGSECDNCEPVYFKRCFCSNSEDCQDCEECNQYGICQSKCKDGEICDGDKCSECSNDIKCPCNKICINGRCTCPQNMFEKDGCCVECDSRTVLSKCEECVNGVIRQKDCAGACDPTTGECVGCLTGGDCSGRADGKTCCKDKVCVCCEGTVFDPISQTCIPEPCKDDAQCGECKKCTPEGCKPIECPVGYQCIGDKCVPECENINCNNGADCGENCGCLDGKCVPCTILSCLNEGGCQAALGCKCSGDVCEPVDNCDQYCDGTTPCLDDNCTCYNNKCVSCENFPCIETEGGCNSYYNCKCSDQNKCEGGKECEDTFVLNKLESCSNDDCALQAVYTSKNKCMCDPIKFEVTNTKVCSSKIEDEEQNPILLSLSVKMFKGTTEYSLFKTNDKFSDDEVITGSIKVVTTVEDASTTVTQDISSLNTIPTISILKPSLTNAKNKTVKVYVFSHSIKVQSNGCTNYSNDQIAYYEFDFNKQVPDDPIINEELIRYCNKLNLYKPTQKSQITDTTSTKKPLIIWYRTSGDTFGTGSISVTSKNYTDKGFFRKRYLTGLGGTYSDKIVKPEEGLLNNFRYKVTIDCACDGANSATTEDVVIYCCPKDLTFINDGSCGKTVKLQPFTNCSVNKSLDLTKYPTESNTKYVVSINGKTGKPLSSFQTIGSEINITDTESIKTIEFYQEYDGNAVVKKACSKTFEFNPVQPEFNLNTTEACTTGKIVVTNANINVNIDTVIAKVGTKTYTFTKTNNLYTSIIPPSDLIDVDLVVEVTFTNGCSNKKTVRIVCSPSIDTDTEPSAYAKAICPGGGNNPKIVVTPSGFTNNALYSLNNGAFQSSNEFLNVPAGTYTVTAKEIINGTEYVVTDTIIIEPAVVPTVSLIPKDICSSQTSTLEITGVEGSSFMIYAPNGSLLTTVTIPVGQSTISVPGLNQPGSYNVSLVTPNEGLPKDKSCFPFSKSVTLTTDGVSLTPTIEIQSGQYCIGDSIPFRIIDNGANATYILDPMGSGTITSPLTANAFSYNGTFTPNSQSASFKISGVQGNCNTTTNPQVNVNLFVPPSITSITPNCDPVTNQHTVTVIAINATSVTIGGVAATSTGTNTWQRTNISGLTEVQVVVLGSNCQVTQTVELQSCNCPSGTILVTSIPTTCGQGNALIQYNGVTSGSPIPNTSWTYVFQNFALGQWGNVGTPQIFNPLSPPTLTPPTTVGVTYDYKLKMVNPSNNCEYYSEVVSVTAIDPPSGITINSVPSQPFVTGVPITFSTMGGYYSYQWSGNVVGNTNTSEPVTFTNPGTYQATVTVFSFDGCSSTANLQFSVGANCIPAITFSPPSTPLCGDISIGVSGGNGSRTYTVDGTIIDVTSTPVPDNGTILIPTTSVPPAGTDSLNLVVTDSNGCSASTIIPYTKCANGCDCTYTIDVVDPTTGSQNLSTWQIISSANGFELAAQVRKLVTKSCGDFPLTTIQNLVETSLFRAFNYGITVSSVVGIKIESMDVINNGTPQTITIPTSYSGGDPQTDMTKLVQYLNSLTLGATFVLYQGVPRHVIKPGNTGGFDYSGSYVDNGTTKDYVVNPAGQSSLTKSKNVSCGTITYTRLYSQPPNDPQDDPASYTITYNSVAYSGTHTATTGITLSGHNPTRVCAGCNNPILP